MSVNLDPRPGDPFPLTTHLLQKITELEREVMEQARLNGMGSEREAGLLGKVGRLERENADLHKRLEILSKSNEKQTEEYICVDREYGLWKRAAIDAARKEAKP